MHNTIQRIWLTGIAITTLSTHLPIAASNSSSQQEQQTAYTEITTVREFDEHLQRRSYTLIKFYAPGRGGCAEIEPAFAQVAQTYADAATALSINIDNQHLYERCKHLVNRGIPTVALVDSSNREITKQIGSSDAETLEQLIAPHLDTTRKKARKKREKPAKKNEPQYETPEITTFDNYKHVMQQHRNVALLLHADWCSPCNMFKPKFASFSQQHPDIFCCMLSVDTLTYDTGLKDELAPYAQDGIPTTLFMQDGIVLKTITGDQPQRNLDDAAASTIAPSQQHTTSEVRVQPTHDQDAKTKESDEKQSRRRGRRRRPGRRK